MSKYLSFSSFSPRPSLKNQLQLTPTTLNKLSNLTQLQVRRPMHNETLSRKIISGDGCYEMGLLCTSCEGYEACIVCVECGERGYCYGCFGRLHAVGKFRCHQTKKIAKPKHEIKDFKQANLESSRTLATINQNSAIRNKNCHKENKISQYQLKQALQNQITNFNIKYQAARSNAHQLDHKIKQKWTHFLQLVQDELQKIKEMLDKFHRNLIRQVKSQKEEQVGMDGFKNQDFTNIEQVKFDITQYQRGDLEINEGQFLVNLRNCNLILQSNLQLNKVMKIKCQQEEKASRTVKIGFMEIRKVISNLSIENILSKNRSQIENIGLADSKFSISSEFDPCKIKKNLKTQKYFDPAKYSKQIKKGRETLLDESLCCYILETTQKCNMVKANPDIVESHECNNCFLIPKTSKRKKTGSGFSYILK